MQFLIRNQERFEDIFPPKSANFHQVWANLLRSEYVGLGGIIDANYDDEGSAQFEVLASGPELQVLEFIGTAK